MAAEIHPTALVHPGTVLGEGVKILDGAVVGIDSFGASAPIDALYKHFGITVDAVVAAARAQHAG